MLCSDEWNLLLIFLKKKKERKKNQGPNYTTYKKMYEIRSELYSCEIFWIIHHGLESVIKYSKSRFF